MTRLGARLTAPSVLGALAAAPLAAQTIAHVKTVGGNGAFLVATGGNFTIDIPAAGAAAGNTLIVAVAKTGSGGASVALTVTDSKANVYANPFNSFSGDKGVGIFHAALTTSLVDSDTITVSWGAFTETTAGVIAAQVEEFDNIATSSPVDKFDSNSGVSSTPSVTIGTNTSQANELVLAAFSTIGNTTLTAGAGYTATPPTCFIGGVGTLITCIYVEFKMVNAIGTQNATGTFLSSLSWQGILITFRDEVVPVELQSFTVDE